MTPQNEAFAEALKQFYEDYPTDSKYRLEERRRAIMRLEEDRPNSALVWVYGTGIPRSELDAVALLIYGKVPP